MHIKGAFDTHVHFAPHSKVKANTDALSLAALAKQQEMSGLVLKCNAFPSVAAAYLAHLTCPETKVFGGIVINPLIGGLNPAAVRAAICYGDGNPGEYCRFVCLPTFYSKRDIEFHKKNEQAIELIKNGQVVDELKEILDLVAENKLVLMSGHVGEDELYPVIQQAKQQGVTNLVLCHPSSPVVNISVEAQKQFSRMGAVMQQCCVETYPYYEKKYGIPGPSFDDLANAIRSVGVEHCIIASDMGADAGINPNPIDGFMNFIDELEKRGFSETELVMMAAKHPQQLFTEGMSD